LKKPPKSVTVWDGEREDSRMRTIKRGGRVAYGGKFGGILGSELDIHWRGGYGRGKGKRGNILPYDIGSRAQKVIQMRAERKLIDLEEKIILTSSQEKPD